MHSLLQTELERMAHIRLPVGPVHIGRVVACDGGLIEVSGQPAPLGSLCTVGSRTDDAALVAETIGFRSGNALMLPLGDAGPLHPGAPVRVRIGAGGSSAGAVGVGDAYLGRAIDALGCPIDGGAPIRASRSWPLAGRREGALAKGPITETFGTGVRAIDALLPMGVGQRMGIVAGSGVGKTMLVDMAVRGCTADAVVVALVGERAREVSDFVAKHRPEPGEARPPVAIIAEPADRAPNLRLRAAQYASALAESMRQDGRRVLLVVDSLTRLAHAAREIALLLGEPGAARGYPPSALAALTRLVERAGGSASTGGAVTGLYTVLADGDDPADPVVDTARAILDGHIVLSRELAQRGQYPAIDIPASLSRAAGGLCDPDHAAAIARFRALAADHADSRELVAMGAYREGSDARIDEALRRAAELAAFVAQDAGEQVDREAAIAALCALFEGDGA